MTETCEKFSRSAPSRLATAPDTAFSNTDSGDITVRTFAAADRTTSPPPAWLAHRGGPLQAFPEQPRNPLAMVRTVTKGVLVQLGALHEEVEVVLPGEAHPAVDLEAGRHHPAAGV